MLLNLKSFFILGLATLSVALPASQPESPWGPLEVRGKTGVKAADCDNISFSKSDIANAIAEGLKHVNKETGHAQRPTAVYRNHEGVLKNLAHGKTYYEYPVEKDSVYTGGNRGKVRAIFDSKKKFMGLVKHTSDTSNSFTHC